MSLTKLYECIERKKVNNSYAREAIYKVLFEAENCISVSEIIKKLQDSYAKKVSLNTVYRHLGLFVECELALVLQDDYKKAYYFLVEEKANAFTLCRKCNGISIVRDEKLENILCDLHNHEFVTIHKYCNSCI